MFTLTAQDLHGVIILEDEQTEESVIADIAEETGLLDPNGCGKTLRVGGGRKHNHEPQLPTRYHQSGGGQQSTADNECCEHEPVRAWDERQRIFCRGTSTDINHKQGRGHKSNNNREINGLLPLTVAVNKAGRNVTKITDVSPCLTARDYKGFAGKAEMIAVIEERKEQ